MNSVTSCFCADGSEPLGEVQRQAQAGLGAARCSGRRARIVAAELQPRGAGELTRPVGELGIERVAVHPVPLPAGKVGVLHGQIGETSRLSGATGLIQRCQVPPKDSMGPAIADQLRHREQQDLFFRGEPNEGDWINGARAWSKRPWASCIARASTRAAWAGAATSCRSTTETGTGVHGPTTCARLALDIHEGGAQDLTTARDVLQALREGGGVQSPAQMYGVHDVVGGWIQRQLFQEPQPVLGIRERQRTLPR